MKIGILTLSLHTNYGGILQAYALQTVLERMGHDVVVLTKDGEINLGILRLSLSWMRTIFMKYVLGRDIKFKNQKQRNIERLEREQYTSTFIEKYIHTLVVKKITQGVFDGMDAVVVGSDQVWRPMYFKEQWNTSIADAFLKFQMHSNIKRVAYAASFGTDDWEYNDKETRECARLLSLFDAVSVREVSAISLCEKHFGRRDAQHVLDPTLLISKEYYIRLVENANTPKSEGNLMCYVLDKVEEKQSIIKKIAKDRGLQPFYTNSRIFDGSAPQKERIQPPLEKWLRGFMDAEFVITDSFHACVFSIIFGKSFVVIGNKERGMARFQSLLSMFSLEKNLICGIEEYNSSCSYGINTVVSSLIEKKKRLSLEFLEKSFN